MTETEYEKMITDIAILVHEKFREIYREKNNGTRVKTTTDKEWIKKYGTDQADIAKLRYPEVSKDWKKSRWLGSKAAVDALSEAKKANKSLDEKFIEYASDIVHNEWLSRNRNVEEEYKLPYKDLSEDAKEKDRIFVRAALEIYQSEK